MSLMPVVIGGALLLKLRNRNAYPLTLYNCNHGGEHIVNDKEEYLSYIKAGYVKDLKQCGLDTHQGRDYGEWDYPNSVDDMPQMQRISVWQTTDKSGNVIHVYSVAKLTYDTTGNPPTRRGYYKDPHYIIGNEETKDYNYDGDRIRTFSTKQAAIDYYESISDTSGGGGSGSGSGGGTPTKPEDDDDDTPNPPPMPPVDPIDPIDPINPVNPVNPISPINPTINFTNIGSSGF